LQRQHSNKNENAENSSDSAGVNRRRQIPRPTDDKSHHTNPGHDDFLTYGQSANKTPMNSSNNHAAFTLNENHPVSASGAFDTNLATPNYNGGDDSGGGADESSRLRIEKDVEYLHKKRNDVLDVLDVSILSMILFGYSAFTS
jgi:hypothetical protein